MEIISLSFIRPTLVSLYQQSVMFVALAGHITDLASAGASTDEDSYSGPLNVANTPCSIKVKSRIPE